MCIRGSGRELFTCAYFLIGLGHKQDDYCGFQLRVQERSGVWSALSPDTAGKLLERRRREGY